MTDNAAPDFNGIRERSLERVRRYERRRKHRVRVAALCGAAVVLVGGTGALWTEIASKELREHSAVCYDSQSRDSRRSDIGSADPDGQGRVELALSMCEASWRQGFSGPNGQDAPPDGIDNPVPKLYACSQPNGILAVFPYENGARRTCGQLGLSEPTP